MVGSSPSRSMRPRGRRRRREGARGRASRAPRARPSARRRRGSKSARPFCARRCRRARYAWRGGEAAHALFLATPPAECASADPSEEARGVGPPPRTKRDSARWLGGRAEWSGSHSCRSPKGRRPLRHAFVCARSPHGAGNRAAVRSRARQPRARRRYRAKTGVNGAPSRRHDSKGSGAKGQADGGGNDFDMTRDQFGEHLPVLKGSTPLPGLLRRPTG